MLNFRLVFTLISSCVIVIQYLVCEPSAYHEHLQNKFSRKYASINLNCKSELKQQQEICLQIRL